MERFDLSIILGNDAMQTAGDIARALRDVASRLEAGEAGQHSIRDDNGSNTGIWELA